MSSRAWTNSCAACPAPAWPPAAIVHLVYWCTDAPGSGRRRSASTRCVSSRIRAWQRAAGASQMCHKVCTPRSQEAIGAYTAIAGTHCRGPGHARAAVRSQGGSVACPGREVYDAGSPGYRGRCTAPLLVDRRTRALVCNESSDIVASCSTR